MLFTSHLPADIIKAPIIAPPSAMMISDDCLINTGQKVAGNQRADLRGIVPNKKKIDVRHVF